MLYIFEKVNFIICNCEVLVNYNEVQVVLLCELSSTSSHL